VSQVGGWGKGILASFSMNASMGAREDSMENEKWDLTPSGGWKVTAMPRPSGGGGDEKFTVMSSIWKTLINELSCFSTLGDKGIQVAEN